jgi:hypothetical protein
MVVGVSIGGIDKIPHGKPSVIVVTQIFGTFGNYDDRPTVSQLFRQLYGAADTRLVTIRDDGNASSGPKKGLQILETTDTVWSAHCRQTHI